jgi:hypothetical protein
MTLELFKDSKLTLGACYGVSDRWHMDLNAR